MDAASGSRAMTSCSGDCGNAIPAYIDTITHLQDRNYIAGCLGGYQNTSPLPEIRCKNNHVELISDYTVTNGAFRNNHSFRFRLTKIGRQLQTRFPGSKYTKDAFAGGAQPQTHLWRTSI